MERRSGRIVKNSHLSRRICKWEERESPLEGLPLSRYPKFSNPDHFAPPCPALYIERMVKGYDNCGALGQVKPLSHMQRSHKRHWEQDQNTFDRKLADRIYRDMQAFIVRRYPGIRWLVLAEVFLTLGAKCAGKAGVGDDEIAEFIHRHKVLRGDPSPTQDVVMVPISGASGRAVDAGGGVPFALAKNSGE